MDTVAALVKSLPDGPQGVFKLGAEVLQEIFIKLKDAKTRKVLDKLDESFKEFEPVFKLLEEKEYTIALNANKETRDAKDFLFATDMELRVIALETITTIEKCKKIVGIMEKKPEKKEKCCEYVEETMKSLIERSKIALDKATARFKELHLKINGIVVELNAFVAKLDKLEQNLETRKESAEEDAKPGFFGKFFHNYKKEEQVVEKYGKAITSTSKAKTSKEIIGKMLNETKEDLENAQSRLSNWIALVQTNKAEYDRGNHVKKFVDLDPELLIEEFDKLNSVCVAYIDKCITAEKK